MASNLEITKKCYELSNAYEGHCRRHLYLSISGSSGQIALGGSFQGGA